MRGELAADRHFSLDVARGLAYIHTLETPIVHGGLKGVGAVYSP